MHLSCNPLLIEIFDLYIETSGDGIDDPNIKAAARARSKQKAREDYHSRNKQRKKKTAFLRELHDEH